MNLREIVQKKWDELFPDQVDLNITDARNFCEQFNVNLIAAVNNDQTPLYLDRMVHPTLFKPVFYKSQIIDLIGGKEE